MDRWMGTGRECSEVDAMIEDEEIGDENRKIGGKMKIRPQAFIRTKVIPRSLSPSRIGFMIALFRCRLMVLLL